MPNQNYPSDLTDSQWEHIKELLPAAKHLGRPRELEMRHVVDAILYVVVGGIQWRMLPRDFPKWQSVYYYFRLWRKGHQWQRLHDGLRAEVRRAAGRHKHPTAGCLDSQSVKTTQVPGVRGFDAAKNIKGRKRHLLVDTLGLLMTIVVTAASVQERDGARLVFARINGSGNKLRRLWVDGGYRGSPLAAWVTARFRFVLQVVLRGEEQLGFVVLPRRWVVERTFAWLNLHRRLSKDYEVLTDNSEAMIYIAMTRLMLRRLKPF
jgi:putative transposase